MNVSRTARFVSACGIVLCGTFAARASENVGAYTIVAAPTAATLVSGGGGAFTWMNAVNVPVSVGDAFTGFGIVDDGYTNAASGTTLQLSFAPGALVNQPGPDLVLFDADNNLNVYLVSTSADGFMHHIAASATTDTGINRSYFVGGQGPLGYEIYATTIDLASFGIGAGQAVDQVRLFTEGPSNDPLGLGVLASPAQVPSVLSGGLIGMALLLIAVSAIALASRGVRARDRG